MGKRYTWEAAGCGLSEEIGSGGRNEDTISFSKTSVSPSLRSLLDAGHAWMEPSWLVNSHHTNEWATCEGQHFPMLGRASGWWSDTVFFPFFHPGGPVLSFSHPSGRPGVTEMEHNAQGTGLGTAQCQELKEFSWHHGVKIKNMGVALEGYRLVRLHVLLYLEVMKASADLKVRNANSQAPAQTYYIRDRAKWLAC